MTNKTVLDEIRATIERNDRKNVSPTYALRLELLDKFSPMSKLDTILEDLVLSGVVSTGDTINDKYYELK